MGLPKFETQGSLFESLGSIAPQLFDQQDRYEWHEDKAHLGLILRPVSVRRGAHFFTRFGK